MPLRNIVLPKPDIRSQRPTDAYANPAANAGLAETDEAITANREARRERRRQSDSDLAAKFDQRNREKAARRKS